MTDFVYDLAGSLRWKREATNQGGLLNGEDPTVFTTSDPLRVWIIQLGVIMMITQLLALILRKIRQPKVIAEVIGGVLLGPTAFGRIPGFTNHIFPAPATYYLSLVANIGLCLFLFLVGLEIEWSVVRRNYKRAPFIAFAGITLPFGLGAALSTPLYHHFIGSSVKYTDFMLFTGVAYSITAFPVLCRILTELKLLDTHVGVTVLSAGVIDDIVGWTLLALCVALVNAGSGLTCLWVLLVCIGWVIFLFLVMKPILLWLARRTGSIENGPTMFFMTVTIFVMFGSSFFTDIVGVQAIFGAFLVGLIVPREGGLCIALTEKLEDMVSIIFLPLYFVISGLNTNLGLLNDGITWGFTIAIISLSFTGKFSGCSLAARALGFSWREAGTVGSFMSCKGLVELIVLNVGLSAGILTQKVFSMFVLEAVVLTFMTTPLVNAFYPPSLRVRLGQHLPQTDVKTAPSTSEADEKASQEKEDLAELPQLGREISIGEERKTRFTIVLDKLEHVPGAMMFLQLIHPPSTEGDNNLSDFKGKASPSASHISVDALRLVELSDRPSAVMRSSNIDPLLSIFRTYGRINGISVSSSLEVVPYHAISSTVAEQAQRHDSQVVVVPWLPAQPTADDGTDTSAPRSPASYTSNPFEAVFRTTNSGGQPPSAVHLPLLRGIFNEAKTDVALFIDRQIYGEATVAASDGRQHIFLPFFGGPDDRLALSFVAQLCAHPSVTATVVRIRRSASQELEKVDSIEKPKAAHLSGELGNEATVHTISAFPDTVYDAPSTQTRMQSETADDLIWSRYNTPQTDDRLLVAALSRIEFSETCNPAPLAAVITSVNKISQARPQTVVMTGRSRRLATQNLSDEVLRLMPAYAGSGGEVTKAVGEVAAVLMATGCRSSIVVLRARDIAQD